MTGRLVSAVLTLVATAVMARSLGPAEFGVVVLMHTYVLTMRALFNLKPAETFVRFAVPLIDKNDLAGINQLLGLVRSFEWVTMLVATMLAVMLVPLVGPWLGLPDSAVVVLMAYSLVLLASPVGTARGFCRATERFDVLRGALAIGPAVRLCGVLLAWYLDATWEYFAAAWGVSLLVSYLYLWVRGARLIRESGYKPVHIPWRLANRNTRVCPDLLVLFMRKAFSISCLAISSRCSLVVCWVQRALACIGSRARLPTYLQNRYSLSARRPSQR